MIKCVLRLFNARTSDKCYIHTYGIEDKRPRGTCTVVYVFTNDINNAMVFETIRKARSARVALRSVGVSTSMQAIEESSDES